MTDVLTAARSCPSSSSRHRSWARTLLFVIALASGTVAAPLATAAEPGPPALLLANLYRADLDLRDWWVSEKYDGVRGYWDGTQLLTRSGERIAVPTWFTSGWPAEPMDGELWAGRGRFEQASATVRRQTPQDAAWRAMRFMVFDLPAHNGPFDARILAIGEQVKALDQPWVQPVVQRKVASHAELQTLLRGTAAAGGEGLMLHRGASMYQAGRSGDLLKLKTHLDAEARVLAVLPGRGKYEGAMGALLVEAVDGTGQRTGLRFKLGTGFTDAERRAPPAIGALVTYRYRDLNASGVPRFASFLRVRTDLADPPPSHTSSDTQ
ncbi:MAG: DNA ligase [Burkholderiaceae bacterium]